MDRAGGPHPLGTCAGTLAAWPVVNMEQRIPRARSRACSCMVGYDVPHRRLGMVCDRLSGSVASHHLHPLTRCAMPPSEVRLSVFEFPKTSARRSAVVVTKPVELCSWASLLSVCLCRCVSPNQGYPAPAPMIFVSGLLHRRKPRTGNGRVQVSDIRMRYEHTPFFQGLHERLAIHPRYQCWL
ncbi:hypothetical protein BT67DRAFT_238599 [Trichocladium antarcticum]|uniref:Uncharacterized protein n=1 Tax=Trichocladium antarcticum TaxID=1450529 RepID=A0AAN6UCL0_9PEZI|nr:hypothetical protein BT67DRAFT_238599 [Trichocladium antarcticum]